MPELPEVEIVKRGLRQEILKSKIVECRVINPNLRYPIPEGLNNKFAGSEIVSITRRSRYICFELSNSRALIFHLGMTGKLIVHPRGEAKTLGDKKHDNLVIYLDNAKALVYNDIRRFGFVLQAENIKNLASLENFKNLGAEPLEPEFNSAYLKKQLSSKNSPIKSALMDNNLVVGVGNIYACESLFEAGISPFKSAQELTTGQISRLVKSIKYTLENAISAGGSSFSNYVQSNGENGQFQNEFKVYGRTGELCYICNTAIKKSKQAGRSSFYCPVCQK